MLYMSSTKYSVFEDKRKIMEEVKKTILCVIILFFIVTIIKSEFRDYDAPLEVKLKASKAEYSMEDSIVISIKLINKSQDVIKFIKPIESYHRFFQIKILKAVRDSLINILDDKTQLIIAITPSLPDGWIILNPGQTYSIEFSINKNSHNFLGKEYFNDIGKYIITFKYHRRILIMSDIGETRYTDKFIWESNELEIEIR